MTVVVDDHLLLSLLAGTAPDLTAHEAASGTIYTTGCWYYRLAKAAARTGRGSLSQRITELSPTDQVQVRSTLEGLPAGIGLLGWRTVVPIMAALRVPQALNLLNAEAIAVALLTSAELMVSVDSPLLRASAAEVGVGYLVVT